MRNKKAFPTGPKKSPESSLIPWCYGILLSLSARSRSLIQKVELQNCTGTCLAEVALRDIRLSVTSYDHPILAESTLSHPPAAHVPDSADRLVYCFWSTQSCDNGC
jgi:hypothetical protein